MSSVINNTNKNIQLYALCGDTIIKPPVLNELASNSTIVIGSQSNADVTPVSCTLNSTYLGVFIWDASPNSGSPNSWLVLKLSDMSVAKSHFDKYDITVTGTITNYTITVNTGKTTNNWWIYILIFIAIIIVVVIGILLIYYFIRHKKVSIQTPSAPSQVAPSTFIL